MGPFYLAGWPAAWRCRRLYDNRFQRKYPMWDPERHRPVLSFQPSLGDQRPAGYYHRSHNARKNPGISTQQYRSQNADDWTRRKFLYPGFCRAQLRQWVSEPVLLSPHAPDEGV